MKQISKTKIERRMRKKRDSKIANAIVVLKKKNPLVAKRLAMPKRMETQLNLEEIEKKVKEGDKILMIGKILSQGELNKKIKIVALNASEAAKTKMKRTGIDYTTIFEEMKKNPELKNLKLLS